METLSSICKRDRRYSEVIKECYLVKNAVILLGGRKEGEEGETGRREEERGGMEFMECIE